MRKPDRTNALAGLRRPYPTGNLTERVYVEFCPAPELWTWMLETFVRPGAPLFNDEHGHLEDANVGVLWTNAFCSKQERRVVGQAEVPNVQSNKWAKARMTYQLEQWFGSEPDFLITLDSVYANSASDAVWCSLCEHEMMHIGHVGAASGDPQYHRDGTPKVGIRGHDVSEFVSVVRRYGAGAAAGETAALVAAAMQAPEIAAAEIAGACGTCLRLAA